MSAILDDIEFLVSSAHRVGVLDTLYEHPCDRTALRATTGASSPTMSRILADFEDRHWIEREGRTYQLTGLGEFVVDQFQEFVDAMTVEQRLRDVSPWLPYELDGFSVNLLTDAVVSYPGPGYPYEPLDRHIQLVESTETLRGFGMVLLKSSILEYHFDCVFDGLECEIIYPPDVFETMLSWNATTITDAVAQDNYTVFLHDDLPNSEWCGICITDDRISICCYEPDTGMLRSLVDTGAPQAYTWGESIFEHYRAEARPLTDAADLPSAESVP
jgi:predicted transcriptional regulator